MYIRDLLVNNHITLFCSLRNTKKQLSLVSLFLHFPVFHWGNFVKKNQMSNWGAWGKRYKGGIVIYGGLSIDGGSKPSKPYVSTNVCC